MVELGQDRGIGVVNGIVAGLQEEIMEALPGQVVIGELPSLEREVSRFPGLSKMRISDLLVPESGAWPAGSKEAQQMEALWILLGDSKKLLDLTPRNLSRVFKTSPNNGSEIVFLKDHSYVVRFLTNVGNPNTGEQLYYTLRVNKVSGQEKVKVNQRLHSRNVSENIY